MTTFREAFSKTREELDELIKATNEVVDKLESYPPVSAEEFRHILERGRFLAMAEGESRMHDPIEFLRGLAKAMEKEKMEQRQ